MEEKGKVRARFRWRCSNAAWLFQLSPAYCHSGAYFKFAHCDSPFLIYKLLPITRISTLTNLRTALLQKRVSVFNRESLLPSQYRITSGQTVELITERVNNKQVTVRTIVVTQTKIHAHRILVDRIDLDQQRGSQKPAK